MTIDYDGCDQTWNLSKNLHCWIFRLKILHRQFYLISTVLERKKTQKMSENGEIYTAGKNFTLPPALTGWTNSTSGCDWHIPGIRNKRLVVNGDNVAVTTSNPAHRTKKDTLSYFPLHVHCSCSLYMFSSDSTTISLVSSRSPCRVLLALSWNTNENPSTDKLSRAIN